jgi:hypothetical protein
MPQPFNDILDVVFSHQHELQMDNKKTECTLTILKSDCYEFEELVSLATQRDDQRCCHKDQIASFQNSKYVEQTDISVEDSFKLAIDSQDSFHFFDCSIHEEEDDEGSLEFPDLQRLSNLQLEHQEICSIYEKEDDEKKGSGQKLSLYFSPTEIKQFTFSIEFCGGKEE